MTFCLVAAACGDTLAQTPDDAPARPSASTGIGTTASKLPDSNALTKMLKKFDVPGLAIATLDGCEPDGVVTLGTADLDADVPVTPVTAFEAASLTKPLFAYLVMQLVDEGVIDLDAPLAPTFDYPRIVDRDAYARLTPRMILSHRTGLPNWVGDTDDPARRDVIAFASPPGTAYSYSGEAYELLRAYVERRTGVPLATLFERRLGDLMPLSTLGADLPAGAERSRGYRAASEPRGGRDLDGGAGGAAGGLVTTVGDYATFLSRVCRGRGLSDETYAEMLEPQSPVPPGDPFAPTSWSLGWGVLPAGPETIFLHDGDNDEYRALAAFTRESDEGYVLLANGANGGDLILAVMEEVERRSGPGAVDERSHDPEADFDAFWTLYDERYALFGVKHVDWDAVRAVHRPRVTPETTRDELHDLFERITDLLNDVHVTVTDRRTGRETRSGGRSIGTGPFDTGVFSAELVARDYAVDGLAAGGAGTLRSGWLENRIGYVHLSAFAHPTATERAIDDAIGRFASARAVLLDLRQNRGGSDAVALLVANRFADRRRLAMTVAERVPGADDAFAAPVSVYVEPDGPVQFTGRVVVLTDSRTISAAENLVVAMRTLPHVRVVGETTAGVMADAYPMDAGNGWTFGVPVNLFRDADGVSWEGIGLVPDLWIANSPEDIARGSDPVLDTAIAFATVPATRTTRPARERVRR